MAQGRIESSIRRLVLQSKGEGNKVPDSLPNLDASPQLQMNPANAEPALRFDDGLGLTDSFGNVYDGYSGAGGFSASITSPISSGNGMITRDLDDVNFNLPTNNQLLIYNGTNFKYEPGLIQTASISLGAVTYSRLQHVNTNKLLGRSTAGTGVVEEIDLTAAGRNLIDDADAAEQRQTLGIDTITDFIAALIENPDNKTYRLIDDLPFDITVTSTSFEFGTGPGTVSFPSGTILAGGAVDITISGATPGTSEDCSLTIDFTRSLV